MKAVWCVACVLSLATTIEAGGLAKHEAAVKEMLTHVDKLVAALGTVKDEESSLAALPLLKQAAKDWDAIRKKAEVLPPPSLEEKNQLEKKFKKPLEEAQKKLFAEVGRVRRTPGGLDALAAISQVLGQKKKDKKD